MDNVDRFYLETVSGAVAGLFEPQGYDPALIDSSDRKYVDPLEFEAYIKSLPAQLWAPEFRNAWATIKSYINRIDTPDIIDALAMATTAVRVLALTYSPEILAELESQQPAQITPEQNQVTNEQSRVTNRVTKCSSAARPELPAGIKDTPGARAAFDSLVTAGYLDSEYKPTKFDKKGKPSSAIYSYIAYILAELFYITYYQKIFGPCFGVSNMSQALRQVKNAKSQAAYAIEIDAALASAAQSCDQLAQTERGKKLIKEYGKKL